jgi:hypothetical protein
LLIVHSSLFISSLQEMNNEQLEEAARKSISDAGSGVAKRHIAPVANRRIPPIRQPARFRSHSVTSVRLATCDPFSVSAPALL